MLPHLELAAMVSPSVQQLHETNAKCEQEHLCGSNTVLGGHSISHDPQPCRRHSYRVQLESAICVHVISRLEQEPQSAFVRIVIKNYNQKSSVIGIVDFESFKRCDTQPWAGSLSVLGEGGAFLGGSYHILAISFISENNHERNWQFNVLF